MVIRGTAVTSINITPALLAFSQMASHGKWYMTWETTNHTTSPQTDSAWQKKTGIWPKPAESKRDSAAKNIVCGDLSFNWLPKMRYSLNSWVYGAVILSRYV